MFNSGLYLPILIFAFCFFFLAICRQCRGKVKKICQEEKLTNCQVDSSRKKVQERTSSLHATKQCSDLSIDDCDRKECEGIYSDADVDDGVRDLSKFHADGNSIEGSLYSCSKGDDICKVQVPGGVGDSGSNDCSCSDDNFGCNNVGDERDVGVDINNQEDDGCDYVCTLAAPNDTVSGRDDNGDSGGNSGDNDVCCGDTSGTDCGYKGNSLVSYICFSGICFYTSYILPI